MGLLLTLHFADIRRQTQACLHATCVSTAVSSQHMHTVAVQQAVKVSVSSLDRAEIADDAVPVLTPIALKQCVGGAAVLYRRERIDSLLHVIDDVIWRHIQRRLPA